MTEQIKVYGYARVSSTEQAEVGASIDMQKSKIEEFSKKNDLNLLNIFVDGGISGGIPPHLRPEMKKLLLNIEAGNAKGLIIYKIDRLSRSIKDFINLMDDFNKRKLEVFIITPEINTKTVYGKFTLNLLSIISELERDMIKERTKETLKHMKACNKRTGTIPFGKRLRGSDSEDNILIDDEEEQQTINICREMRNEKYLKNGKAKAPPYSEICDKLTELNRKNKGGHIKWFPNQIKNMLK